jgi:hypothetical protein
LKQMVFPACFVVLSRKSHKKKKNLSSFSETHSTLTMVGPYFDLGSKWLDIEDQCCVLLHSSDGNDYPLSPLPQNTKIVKTLFTLHWVSTTKQILQKLWIMVCWWIPGTLIALILDAGYDISPVTFGIEFFRCKILPKWKNEYVVIFFVFPWKNCQALGKLWISFWPHLDSKINLEAFL